MDKSKDKTNAETNTNVKLPEAQSKKSRSHIDSGPKLFASGKGFGNSGINLRILIDLFVQDEFIILKF